MTVDTLAALFLFAIATLFTPGPNNAMLASSGANFGFARSIPHMLGVALGFAAMLFATGLGLGALFEAFPQIAVILKYAGFVIMMWLAWKISSAGKADRKEAGLRPFRFHEAVAFQTINPKGWSIAIAVSAQFADPQAPFLAAAACGGVYAIVGMVSATTWTGFGVGIRRFLNTDTRLISFNILMGLTVAGCAIWMLFE